MISKSARVLVAIAAFCVVGTLLVSGCRSTAPLKLRHNSCNLIVDKDGTVRIEKDVISLDSFRRELVSRLVFERAFIIVHVHEQASQELFQKVVDLLKQEGYQNLEFEVFSD